LKDAVLEAFAYVKPHGQEEINNIPFHTVTGITYLPISKQNYEKNKKGIPVIPEISNHESSVLWKSKINKNSLFWLFKE
jgi:hypothetical protein